MGYKIVGEPTPDPSLEGIFAPTEMVLILHEFDFFIISNNPIY